MITIPALPRPTLKQLKAEREWIKSIESDNSTEEAVEIEFVSVLKKGEKYINGSEYESRLKLRDDVVLGWQHGKWLNENQDQPEVKEVLGALRKEGVWYIDFPGLVVVGEDGNRCVPYLYGGGGRFVVRWDYLGSGFFGDGRVAVSSKSAKTGKLKPSARSLEPSDTLPLELEINGVRYKRVK